MPLSHLRNVRIETVDQEKIVQEIVNIRVAQNPAVQRVYRGDVPFYIKTIEEEQKWQKIIDERTKAIVDKLSQAGKTQEQLVEAELAKLEAQKAKIVQDIKPAFCQFCDSKRTFHKRNCTRVK